MNGTRINATSRWHDLIAWWLDEQYTPVRMHDITAAFGWSHKTTKRRMYEMKRTGCAIQIGAGCSALWVSECPTRRGAA